MYKSINNDNYGDFQGTVKIRIENTKIINEKTDKII